MAKMATNNHLEQKAILKNPTGIFFFFYIDLGVDLSTRNQKENIVLLV